jgi:hypothetical protein
MTSIKNALKKLQKGRKLKRDAVVSIANGRELVGVYYADTNGYTVLFEASPRTADRIIKWHNARR